MPYKPPLTHFLALPLYNSGSAQALTTSISYFERKNATQQLAASDSHHRVDPSHFAGASPVSLAKESNRDVQRGPMGLPEGSIRPASTLHLTLGVLSLTTPERVETAVSLLRNLDVAELLPPAAAQSPTHSSTPLEVELRGLHSMYTPSATSVLYAAPVDATGRLLPLCLGLRAKLAEWGILEIKERELKLHATIVNTVYAEGTRSSKRGEQKLQIDARDHIERWKDHVWATVAIDKVVLCEMGAKKDANGLLKYHEVAEASLKEAL